MRARLAAQFADMKLPGELVYTHTLDMRFVGQAFEVGVEIPADPLGSLDAAYLAGAVRRRPSPHLHARRHARSAGRDRDPAGRRRPCRSARRRSSTARRWRTRAGEQAKIFHGEAWIDCARHTAEALTAGQKIAGPAVIEGYTATTWVPPGWTAELDAADNLILRRIAMSRRSVRSTMPSSARR